MAMNQRLFQSFRSKNSKVISVFRKYSQARTSHLEVDYLQNENKGIVVLGLNRPERKNSLGMQLVTELNEAVNKLNFEQEARVLVIRSLVPGIFCAGADLKERSYMSQAQVSQFVSNLRTLMDKIHNLPVPVLSALDGSAFGGGLELSLAGDMRIASSEAKMGLVETRLAILPGAGGTQRLPRLINPSVAKELIYTARIITAQEARNLGLVNHVIDQNASQDSAYLKCIEVAQEILPNGPVAVRMAKLAINKGLQADLNTGLSIEEACYAQVIPTRDRLEGLQAFQEKRKPIYTGQ